MVRQNTHKTQIFSGLAALAILVFVFALLFPIAAKADNSSTTTFKVNVSEALTVSLVTPDTWASGSMSYDSTAGKWVSGLLRNEVQLSVASNNTSGFTASMTSDSTTSAALANVATDYSTDTIPTLDSTWTRSNTANTLFWGYSTDDENQAGTYSGIPLKDATTPATLISNAESLSNNGSVNKNIYFGAKADSTVASGTYAGTVVISVVSGTIDASTNPTIPSDPATPIDPGMTNPVYDAVDDRTVYTSTSTDTVNNTTTTTTTVSSGDTTATYADPQGVTRISEGTPLATGLAVTAGIAAATGVFFFALAKKRGEDEED